MTQMPRSEMGPGREERLAELVTHLTGADFEESLEAVQASPDREPLGLVARAILDGREADRALRVTRYLDADGFTPQIDLRDGSGDESDRRFRRPGRAASHPSWRSGDRSAGTMSTGFVPA
jgi:hypothetical protein